VTAEDADPQSPAGAPADLVEFFRLVGDLKHLPRQGWIDRGIASPESVADHTYRMALMAWMLGERAGLNTSKLLKMVLVHDLPEALAGDATPYQVLIDRGLSAEDAAATWHDVLTEAELAIGHDAKSVAEASAIGEIARHLDAALATELSQLWEEYARRSSPEAQFASQIDKIEALMQALEYQGLGQPADVESFRRTAASYVTHPVLRDFLESLDHGPNTAAG
jgi:putative hydrolases of HD superfamily